MLKSGVYTQLAPIRFGCGSVSTVGETAKSLGIRKAMIVTDAGVVNAGHDQKVMASLKEAGIAALLWDEVQPECPDSALRAARKFALDNKVDGLIGLGGGSSMDTAKISSIMIPNDIDDILTHLNAYLFRERTYANPAIPVILIPTTFGTGAESTYCGVVSSEVEDAKIGVLCEPSYGIVDPTLALGLPKQGTAFTGMDAFSHALEALGHVNRTPTPTCWPSRRSASCTSGCPGPVRIFTTWRPGSIPPWPAASRRSPSARPASTSGTARPT